MRERSYRIDCLRDLISLGASLEECRQKLASLDSSSEPDLVTFTVGDLFHALESYFSGRLTEATLVDWAEIIQGRDDIRLDPVYQEPLADALFRLSTPELFGTLPDVARAIHQEWRRR